MTDNVFIDTNILVYLSSNDSYRKEKVVGIVYELSNAMISTQVLGEFSNVAYRNKIISSENLIKFINKFYENFEVVIITERTIIKAIKIKSKYKFSFWDSMIIASALENNCSILYSEDMQHNQIIENILKIINPFL